MGLLELLQYHSKNKHNTAVPFTFEGDRSFEDIFMKREGTGEDFGNIVALKVEEVTRSHFSSETIFTDNMFLW